MDRCIQLDVTSEYGQLLLAVAHRPGQELLLPPVRETLKYYLWDDIVQLSLIHSQHDLFIQGLSGGGAKILYIEDLVADVCEDPEVRKEVANRLITLVKGGRLKQDLGDGCSFSAESVLALTIKYDGTSFAQFLISGFEKGSLNRVMRPIPNILFMRDPGAVAGNCLFLSTFAMSARYREELVLELMLRHPLLQGINVCNVAKEALAESGRLATFEGGDILVVNERLALIGMGERTNEVAVNTIANRLAKINMDVAAIKLPKKRSYIHIDTVKAIVSPELYLAYAPMFNDEIPTKSRIKITAYRSHNGVVDWDNPEYGVTDVLHDYGYHGTPIFVGGSSSLHQNREQYTCAPNVITIRPNAFILYQRNEETARVLREEHGFIVTTSANADEFREITTSDDLTRVVLLIEDSELVRGRGGPHCMTMPLRRKA